MATTERIKPSRRFEGCPITETLSGMPIKPVYTPEDVEDIDYQKDLANPGEYPFTRGIWSDMYRGKLWTRRVFTGLGSGMDTNERYRYLLAHGETGLYWFGDVPSYHGIDPDHPLAKGTAGVSGVSYCCLRDVHDMFEGISLEDVSVSHNSTSMVTPVSYAAFVANAEDEGFDLRKLTGSVINEPMQCTLTVHNTNSEPIDLAVKVCTDLIEYSIEHTPRWHPLAPNAYDLKDYGAYSAEEMAFTIAITREYIERMLDRGHDIDEFASRINVFGCSTDIDFFEEIAKYRAVRKVWARLMKEKYGAKKPESCRLYLSSHTEGTSLTRAQPVNNIIRVTLQTLACVLGGLQSVDPTGYLEAYYTLTEEEALTNLNLQNILAYEAGVAATADPLAGSYYVESLTSQLEEGMWGILDEIERKGGAIAVTKSGWMRSELDRMNIDRQKKIEEKKRIIVGLNEFVVPKEQEVPIKLGRDRTLGEQIATSQRLEQRIIEFKERRDKSRTKAALESLGEEATKGEKHNLIPAIIEALRVDATMGEILGVIRQANGADYDPLRMVSYPF